MVHESCFWQYFWQAALSMLTMPSLMFPAFCATVLFLFFCHCHSHDALDIFVFINKVILVTPAFLRGMSARSTTARLATRSDELFIERMIIGAGTIVIGGAMQERICLQYHHHWTARASLELKHCLRCLIHAFRSQPTSLALNKCVKVCMAARICHGATINWPTEIFTPC